VQLVARNPECPKGLNNVPCVILEAPEVTATTAQDKEKANKLIEQAGLK